MTATRPTMQIGNGVCDIKTWSPFASDTDFEFEYIDIASIDRDQKVITNTNRMRAPDAPSRARQVVHKGDVLVSTVRPGLNAVAMVPTSLNGAIASTGFTVLRCDERCLHGPYLFHWVRSTSFVDEMVRLATGASYPAVSDRIIKNSGIPLPFPDEPRRSLAEQKRIAAILDKADAIHRRRQEAARLTDTLIPSIFHEMFGDPITNSRRLPKCELTSYCRIVTGNTPSRAVSDYYGPGIEWIKSDNINTPLHVLTRATETLSAAGKEVGRVAPIGSTLITCIAGSPSCIGNVAMANREVAFNQQINAAIPADSVDPIFLYTLLLVSKKLIQSASTSGMKGMVSKSALEKVRLLSIEKPGRSTLSLRIKTVLMSLDRSTRSETESEVLFNALVERAFRGEL